MANFKTGSGFDPEIFKGCNTTLRTGPKSGKTLQKAHPRRTLTTANVRFVQAVRNLANDNYPGLTPAERAAWKEPFGPAAWTRTQGIVQQKNPWTCFVCAHLGEIYYRGRYYPSSPNSMPNDAAPPSNLVINWSTHSISLTLTTHWYTTPTAADCWELYQISPRKTASPDMLYYTKRFLTFTAFTYPTTVYNLTATFPRHVRLGRALGLFSRMRTTGGHSLGTVVTVWR